MSPAAAFESPRRVEVRPIFRIAGRIAPESDVQRAAQNAFVGGEPSEAKLRGDFESLIGNRTFGGPQAQPAACRRCSRESGARARAARAHPADSGTRDAAAACADSRRGRCRCRTAAEEWDGSTAWSRFRSGRARPRGDTPEARRRGVRAAYPAASALSSSVKFTALLGKLANGGILGEIFLVHPGELREDLQVAPVAEVPMRDAGLGAAGAHRATSSAKRGQR